MLKKKKKKKRKRNWTGWGEEDFLHIIFGKSWPMFPLIITISAKGRVEIYFLVVILKPRASENSTYKSHSVRLKSRSRDGRVAWAFAFRQL